MRKRIALFLLALYCLILLCFGLFRDNIRQLFFPNVETERPSFGILSPDDSSYYPCIVPSCAVSDDNTIFTAVTLHEKWGERCIAKCIPVRILAAHSDRLAIDLILPDDTLLITASSAPLSDGMVVYMMQK